ncbi:MAG: ATP-binding protein [Actinomycetota bacterium]
MSVVAPRPRAFPAAVALTLAVGALLIVPLLVPVTPRARALTWDALAVVCGLVATAVIARSRGREGQWQAAGTLALATFSVAVAGAVFFVIESGSSDLMYEPSLLDAGFLVIAVLFLFPLRVEFRAHFEREDRREIATDIALITAAIAVTAYLSLLPAGADTVTILSTFVFSLSAAAAFTSYGALALWFPSPAHVGMAIVFTLLSAATLALGDRWVHGLHEASEAGVPMAFAIGGLVLAGLVAFLPERGKPATGMSVRWGRPLLTSIAVAAACAALASVTVAALDNRIDATQTRLLIGLLAAGIALRILVNQVRSTRARRDASRALQQKDAALAATDLALERLREANDTLRTSEEHLRLVFEAAVDGIVELDEHDVVMRCNDSFCRMVKLPRQVIEGQSWSGVASGVDGADESFTKLLVTGQGMLQREGQPLYLEARVSEIPSTPPVRLLLVRDVTAARVADQTIRSLFQFLQDRDEDRTRIMRRTNTAIESERNRIARDLHDGPVQGVSAASLSLEAALLMIKAGEFDDGLDILGKIRKELSEEADNLRRLMSGLRPPLLEERGLVPAIRETLLKFGTDQDVETEFSGEVQTEVPTDLETLAYRIVQEALSNAGKHSQATKLTVAIEADGGQLRLEVVDDGVGFDAAKARDYLREGRVGLASMRERVELANGTFMVHSTPGKGTTILATLPLDSHSASREMAV